MGWLSTAGLISVVVLVLANGFFVAAEFAMVAVRRSRLEELGRQGRRGVRAAQEVVGHLDAYIAACQLGITMASLALGWIGEPALAGILQGALAGLLGSYAPMGGHVLAVAIAFSVITALHIVVGELAPKGLALQAPEATVLWVARPLQAFYSLFRWPITALNAVGNGMLRLVGLQPSSGHDMVHSVEELRLLVRASQEAGVVEESEARIASRAFRFADLTAGSLMTPRMDIEGIEVTASQDEVAARAAASRHSRLVVYEESLDNIVGVLRVRDLVPVLARPRPPFVLRDLLCPVLAVPETQAADDLLEDMRRHRCQVAVVVDEYGVTVGLTTFRDLMRALVGPAPEEGRVGPGAAGVTAPPEPDGSVVLDGLTRLDELVEATGLDLTDADRDAVDTLSGLIMTRLDRMPQVGDALEVGGRRITVEALQGHRVGRARILPPGSPRPAGRSEPLAPAPTAALRDR